MLVFLKNLFGTAENQPTGLALDIALAGQRNRAAAEQLQKLIATDRLALTVQLVSEEAGK
jgi:hypothetical protein